MQYVTRESGLLVPSSLGTSIEAVTEPMSKALDDLAAAVADLHAEAVSTWAEVGEKAARVNPALIPADYSWDPKVRP